MVALSMRYIFVLLLSSFALAASADEIAPDKFESLPPPPVIDDSLDDEPEVTILKKTEQTIEEYRMGGRLYMIKVTPTIGAPYYLVDDQGDGKFSRQESLDTGLRPPRWIIQKF